MQHNSATRKKVGSQPTPFESATLHPSLQSATLTLQSATQPFSPVGNQLSSRQPNPSIATLSPHANRCGNINRGEDIRQIHATRTRPGEGMAMMVKGPARPAHHNNNNYQYTN